MALNVGELVAYLRLDMGDFEEKLAGAQTAADKLDSKNVDVKVKADTAVAEEKLAAVAASEDAVDEGNKKVAASSKSASQGMGAVAAAVILLGPALVPVAAGAAGLAVGFGAMGTAGVLAIVGISQQMTAGTALGGSYTAMLATLKGDLTTLSTTAATGVLGPFQLAVADLQTKMPALNGLVGDLSAVTGKTAGVMTTGLVAAFLALAPLERDASVYILGLTNRFAVMMSGPGVVAFGDYVRSVFPQVMQAVESIVGAAGHLVGALAPLGLGTLGILQTLAGVINALPVNVLAVLATTASSVYLGFEAFKLLSMPLGALSTALQGVGVSAETAAAGVRSLTIAAGVIGAIIGVATLVYSAFADSQRQNTQAANDFADAIREDNGLLGENTRAMAANSLEKADALEAGRTLGLSMSTLTDYALGNADAIAKVNAVTDAAALAAHSLTAANGSAANSTYENYQAALKLRPALADTNKDLQTGAQSQKDVAEATAASTAATSPFTAAQDALAAKIGTTSAALVTATAGQQTTAKAAQDAAAKMYVENDAAGILKGSLDILNGKALGLMQAQTADAAATNSAAAALVKNSGAIDGNSDAAIANQQALQSKAQASQAEAEAVGKATGSTTEAVKAYGESKAALEASLKAQGLLTPAVQAYIDKLYAVSNIQVTPTKLDVDKAAADAAIAALQIQVNSIRAQPVVISFTANYSAAVATALGAARAGIQLNLPGHAGGGMITGPGSSTSDSILGVNANGVPITRVSKDEFVVNAVATARNRALLDAINSGQQVGAGTGSVNNFYMNPSTGMNEEALAMDVARRFNLMAAV